MAAPGHQTDLISIYTFSDIAAEMPAVMKTPRILVAPRPRVLGDHKFRRMLSARYAETDKLAVHTHRPQSLNRTRIHRGAQCLTLNTQST